MIASLLATATLFHIGPVDISALVVATWVMALLGGGVAWYTRCLSLTPSKVQTVLELAGQHHGRPDSRHDASRARTLYRSLIGTLFLFILVSNWSSLLPGVEPPTAHVETDAALALIVFCTTIFYGVRTRGLGRYLATFAEPTWIMIPLNVVEQITRTFRWSCVCSAT